MADRSRAFLSETAAMRTLGVPTEQSDWGFRVGVTLIALFAAAELAGVAFYYVGRHRATTASVAPPPAIAAPSAAPAVPAVAPSTAPVAAPSVAAAAAPSAPPLAPADRLLQEARALRERGDTTNAIARLQEAAQRDPKNAAVLAEMAGIYESIQLYDRSNETWRRIEEIGPSAGSLYETAQNKLKVGAAATNPAATNTTSAANTTVANAAPAVTPPPMPNAAAPAVEQPGTAPRTGTAAIADGTTLGLGEVAVTEAPDNEADTNLTVRVPIKKAPGAVIDHTKVTIRVYFYDTIGTDPKPVLTDAQTNFEWLTPSHDWATNEPEVLAVSYYRPKNQAISSEAALSAAAAAVVPGKKPRPASAASTDGGNRHYLGYIVRIYYNDKLQAQKAQPSKLLAIFPSPASSQ